jgi:hypothetical protein
MRLQRAKQQDDREPIGIVIADGSRGHAVPRFAAFVWGPVPDDLLDLPTTSQELAVTA